MHIIAQKVMKTKKSKKKYIKKKHFLRYTWNSNNEINNKEILQQYETKKDHELKEIWLNP